MDSLSEFSDNFPYPIYITILLTPYKVSNTNEKSEKSSDNFSAAEQSGNMDIP